MITDYECEGQLSLTDTFTSDCRKCRKFKTDCPEATPAPGWCNRYKFAPEWQRIDRCQNCSRWVYTGDQTKPISWGVFGACLEHDQKTDACGYCMQFDGMGDKEYWKEIKDSYD